MDKTITVKTLIGFISAIGIPILVFMYTFSVKMDRNEVRSLANEKNIQKIILVQEESFKRNDVNFDKVLDKLHEIDLKLKDKANRK